MAQSRATESHTRNRKICVLGSSGYFGVTCASWDDVDSINLVDYQAVILNVATLSLAMLTPVDATRIRSQLSRLLASGGTMAILAVPLEIDRQVVGQLHNYSWCPIKIGVQNESGDSILVKADRYPRLSGIFSQWNFWDLYFNPSKEMQTDELSAACGGEELDFFTESIVENRYGGMLFGQVDISYSLGNTFSKVWLFAHTEDQDESLVIRMMLEDLFGISQVTVPPAWAETVTVPGLIALQEEIDKKNNEIEAIESEKAKLESKKGELNKYKKLLYAEGKELEDIFARCLEELGGIVTPARYGQEEFILESGTNSYLVECKGVVNSIAIKHLRQLIDYVLLYEEKEQKPGKGILFANVWRGLPPETRGVGSNVIFPPAVISRATKNDIVLVDSVSVFQAFNSFLEGKATAASILERITSGVGVVDFRS